MIIRSLLLTLVGFSLVCSSGIMRAQEQTAAQVAPVAAEEKKELQVPVRQAPVSNACVTAKKPVSHKHRCCGHSH